MKFDPPKPTIGPISNLVYVVTHGKEEPVWYGVLDNFKVVVRRVVLPPNEWFWELAVGFTPDGPSEWRRMDLNDECDRDALGCIMPMSQWGSTDGPA